jgi:hypothetical protein
MNQASYGETSGFVPVSCMELETVNGGGIIIIPPWIALGLLGTAVISESKSK